MFYIRSFRWVCCPEGVISISYRRKSFFWTGVFSPSSFLLVLLLDLCVFFCRRCGMWGTDWVLHLLPFLKFWAIGSKHLVGWSCVQGGGLVGLFLGNFFLLGLDFIMDNVCASSKLLWPQKCVSPLSCDNRCWAGNPGAQALSLHCWGERRTFTVCLLAAGDGGKN